MLLQQITRACWSSPARWTYSKFRQGMRDHSRICSPHSVTECHTRAALSYPCKLRMYCRRGWTFKALVLCSLQRRQSPGRCLHMLLALMHTAECMRVTESVFRERVHLLNARLSCYSTNVVKLQGRHSQTMCGDGMSSSQTKQPSCLC